MPHDNDSWSRGYKERATYGAPRLAFTASMFIISKFAIVAIPLLLAGCATTTVDLSHYSVRQVPPLEQTALLTIAEEAMREQGYVVYQRDASIGSIRASANATSTPQRISRMNQHSDSTRRHAEILVQGDDEQPAVYCKVLLQQRVTEAHRMLQRDYSGQDTPNETPIDRDAATTEEQNTLWRTIRRDRRSEHDLLNAIDEASTQPLATPK